MIIGNNYLTVSPFASIFLNYFFFFAVAAFNDLHSDFSRIAKFCDFAFVYYQY